MVTENPSVERANAPRRSTGEIVRFAVVGVANTVVHYSVYLLLWLFLPYLVAHLIAVAAATSSSYLLNCRYTFRIRPSWRTFIRYPLSNLTNIALSTASCAALVELLGVDSRIATILGGLIAFPATFVISRVILVGSRTSA